MPITSARAGTIQQSVEAKIIHPDGSVTDLGTVAFQHRNPLRQWAWNLRQFAKHLAARRHSRRK